MYIEVKRLLKIIIHLDEFQQNIYNLIMQNATLESKIRRNVRWKNGFICSPKVMQV